LRRFAARRPENQYVTVAAQDRAERARYAPTPSRSEARSSAPARVAGPEQCGGEERNVCAENPVGTAPVKATVSPEDLEKLDIRVGKIEAVDDIATSDKLVRLTVDFGDFKRTILVGMKREREDPSEIKGRQALFVVNLAPRKMMGEVSEGMVFDIGYADGVTPVLAVPEKPVPNGTRAG
jgi:methionine--tRNA ligase beta chain